MPAQTIFVTIRHLVDNTIGCAGTKLCVTIGHLINNTMGCAKTHTGLTSAQPQTKTQMQQNDPSHGVTTTTYMIVIPEENKDDEETNKAIEKKNTSAHVSLSDTWS